VATATGLPTVFDFLSFHPAAAAGPGLWTIAELSQLEAALPRVFATPPPILIDGVGVVSRVPDPQLPLYGATPEPGGLPEAAQASAYSTTISAAACDPTITGVILDRLVDAHSPVPATGLYYPDGTPKPSAAAVAAVAGTTQRGQLVCPGLQTPASPAALTFPSTLASGSAAAVRLACARDCLYLVTLEGADGAPVVARRGALNGGAAVRTIGVPKATLAPGDYSIAVRLVTQVNPGAVTLLTSGPLTVS
jgi:hypothetical protein